MQQVSLAIYWHQHQPYYPDDVSGENLMPWVRLHGTKDYYGMALHLLEVPEFRCTINLVPSLLEQILAYTDHGASDRHLDVSRMPADGLSETDAHYLLDHFFMANLDSMVRPYPRYQELYLKRGFGIDTTEQALPRFNEKDLRDLQVWNNLTWFHPLAFEQDADLRTFLEKGQRWSEEEKQWLLDKQMEILRQVIPLHKQLSDSGQVELTTTPFYHPILPLLWNKKSARQAMPNCALPANLDSYKEDALIHLERGVEFHRELFGMQPAGMWPSEGSVSQEIVEAIADQDIQWIATDEEILGHSTNGWVSRDGQGHLRHPEMLFRPWRVEANGKPLQIIFRDHAMSDLIGFHYQRSDAEAAANDLLSRVEGIARAVEPHNGGRPALVPIILDGENCWEYYADGGVKFLRTLYQKAVAHPYIRPVRVQDHLEEHPATDRIGQLFAGSWISHNFAIWIGHQEDNDGWDRLHETREFLKEVEAKGEADSETLQKAWRELYIAEGSDWFWWYGDDHSSEQDALFDQLFRKHLKNVYTLLGHTPPQALSQPISQSRQRVIHSQPTAFLDVPITGRSAYFDWISAGHYESGSERGTMTLVTEGVVHDIYFGFHTEALFVRIDTKKSAKESLGQIDEIRIAFTEPAESEVRITNLTSVPTATLYCNHHAVTDQIEVAVDQIVELKIPFQELGISENAPIQFFVEAYTGQQSLDRAPSEGAIECRVPSADFEQIHWLA